MHFSLPGEGPRSGPSYTGVWLWDVCAVGGMPVPFRQDLPEASFFPAKGTLEAKSSGLGRT